MSLSNIIIVWGGAKFHDYHHKTSKHNYGSTFIIWDKVFGTYNIC